MFIDWWPFKERGLLISNAFRYRKMPADTFSICMWHVYSIQARERLYFGLSHSIFNSSTSIPYFGLSLSVCWLLCIVISLSIYLDIYIYISSSPSTSQLYRASSTSSIERWPLTSTERDQAPRSSRSKTRCPAPTPPSGDMTPGTWNQPESMPTNPR